tara:strand:- start:2483 stop:3469 length:987 start_codon:yes stop_codon:yes gene_type:complete
MEKKKLNTIKKYLKKINLNNISRISIIKSGKNNKIYKINVDKKIVILKSYFGEKKLRIKKELQFYRYLNQQKIKNVVTPIAFELNKNFLILPYIDGNKIRKIEDKHIIKISNFINKINKKKNFKKLDLAVEGIKNRKKYISICYNRIKKLKLVSKRSVINKKLQYFLNQEIIPTFKILKKKLNEKNILDKVDYKLYKKDMIISPSDFGFHNVIESNKKLIFFDFEYSGYDDPVKLVCDFYCQPNKKISLEQKEKFKNSIIKKFKNYEKIDYLISQLLPLHYLKWCCIILNEFIPSKLSIRNHAGQVNNNTLKKQLIKARKYFNQNLKV